MWLPGPLHSFLDKTCLVIYWNSHCIRMALAWVRGVFPFLLSGLIYLFVLWSISDAFQSTPLGSCRMVAVCSDLSLHSHLWSDASALSAILQALSNHFDGFCAGGSATASVLSLMLSSMGKEFNVHICRGDWGRADGKRWLVFRFCIGTTRFIVLIQSGGGSCAVVLSSTHHVCFSAHMSVMFFCFCIRQLWFTVFLLQYF